VTDAVAAARSPGPVIVDPVVSAIDRGLMSDHSLTAAQVADFKRDGYVVARGFFDQEQMDHLHRIAKGGFDIENSYAAIDPEGKSSRLLLRNDLPEDIYSAFVRSERMVDSVELLLGDEAYHFHHKLMLKEPRVGGAWPWHQDYGYWYDKNSCLFPTMLSAMIAVDKASIDNGCLQVLKGSHLCGRLDHVPAGGQLGADPERVDHLKDRLELVNLELDPGDTAFFDCNLLHASQANTSERARWTLICCFNARSNDPFDDRGEHPGYSYLERWPDSRIAELGAAQWSAMSGEKV